MRHHFVFTFFLVACVSGDDTSNTDAGKDASSDTTQQNDVASNDVVTDVATEAGPFNANSYPNLELWLSADVGAGDAGTVATWQDRSAKNRVVSVPSSDPDCTTGPALVQNAQHGLPMAKFDGTFTCMTVSGAFTDFTAGFTAFVVMEPGNCNSNFTGGSAAIFDSFDPTSGYQHGIAIVRDKAIANTASGDAMLMSAAEVGGEEVQIIGSGSWVPATPHLLEFRLPAAPSNQAVAGLAYVDGTLASLGTNGPVTPDFTSSRTKTYIGDRLAPGASSYHVYCGMLGEMLIYSKALADADRQAIESHLKTRWGL